MLEIVAADGRVTNAEASLLSHAMRSWSEGLWNTEWGLAAGRDARIAGGKVVAGRCRVVLPGRPRTRVCGERPQPCRPFGKRGDESCRIVQ